MQPISTDVSCSAIQAVSAPGALPSAHSGMSWCGRVGPSFCGGLAMMSSCHRRSGMPASRSAAAPSRGSIVSARMVSFHFHS